MLEFLFSQFLASTSASASKKLRGALTGLVKKTDDIQHLPQKDFLRP